MSDGPDGSLGRPSESDGSSSDGQRADSLAVVVLRAPKKEGHEILNDFQYWHVAKVIMRLADFGDKAAIADLRINPFGKYWALKLKGGVLKKVNLRVYFAFLGDRREIVILKTYKKEEEGQAPPHIEITLDDRLEDYLAGERQGITQFRRGIGRS